LFLDYYQGYTKSDEGKIKTQRKVEYMKIYILDNPKSPSERQKNEQSLSLAQLIRNNRESDLQHNSEGLIAPFRKKNNFFDYCDAYSSNYQKKDIRMIKAAVREFKSFTNENYLTPQQIDQSKVKGFRDYLINKYNGETPNSFFARFKKVLNAATDDGLFVRSPAEKVICKAPVGIPKEIHDSFPNRFLVILKFYIIFNTLIFDLLRFHRD